MKRHSLSRSRKHKKFLQRANVSGSRQRRKAIADSRVLRETWTRSNPSFDSWLRPLNVTSKSSPVCLKPFGKRLDSNQRREKSGSGPARTSQGTKIRVMQYSTAVIGGRVMPSRRRFLQ